MLSRASPPPAMFDLDEILSLIDSLEQQNQVWKCVSTLSPIIRMTRYLTRSAQCLCKSCNNYFHSCRGTLRRKGELTGKPCTHEPCITCEQAARRIVDGKEEIEFSKLGLPTDWIALVQDAERERSKGEAFDSMIAALMERLQLGKRSVRVKWVRSNAQPSKYAILA